MNDTTPAALQRLLASEFERHGWEWDIAEGGAIVEEIVGLGAVYPQLLAQKVSGTYLQRVGATRADLAEAIERAVGGRIPRPDQHVPTTLIINDNRHQLNMGPGAQIVDSQVNVGGVQVNVRADSPKDDVLSGVATLVRAGLNGDWNSEAARDLAAVIDSREDVALSDVEAAVAEIVAEEPPEPGRARQMIESISTQGLGGALAVGIVKGLAALIGLG